MYKEGDASTIRDIEFEGMTVIGLMKKLKGTCQFPIKGIYFLIPGKELSNGLMEIKDDSNLAECITLAFKNEKLIDIYLEHHGSDLSHWVQTEIEDGEVLDVGEMENITGYSVSDFELLIDSDDEGVDTRYKVVDYVVYPEFDHSLPWNKMKPTLGLRRNDHRSLMVLCGIAKGRCGGKKCKKEDLPAKKGNAKGLQIESPSKKEKGVTLSYSVSHEDADVDIFKRISKDTEDPSWSTSIKTRRQRRHLQHWKHCSLIEHYSRLWDYRKQILDTNPALSVHLHVKKKENGKTHFHRFYVCFKAMKEGWSAGCRKVIGLDGCFLKGTVKRELLTAMDLRYCQGAYMTVISDGHKHRQCARHIYANFKKKWNGLHYKSLFWGVASTTIHHQFYSKMNLIDRGCATYENGIYESYHNAIRIARVGGSSMCPNTKDEPSLPPVQRKMPGRPRKLRIKHVTERVNEVSRSGRMMTCQLCWQKGHSKKTCKNEPQPKPTKEKKKPERKKVGSAFVFPSGEAANDVYESDTGGGARPSNAGGVEKRCRWYKWKLLSQKIQLKNLVMKFLPRQAEQA
ncbi:hypothetical protein Tco_0255175 [Tanacetum coccineum]